MLNYQRGMLFRNDGIDDPHDFSWDVGVAENSGIVPKRSFE